MKSYTITLDSKHHPSLPWTGKGFQPNGRPRRFTDRHAAIEEAEHALDVWADLWVDYSAVHVHEHDSNGEGETVSTIIHGITLPRFPGLAKRAANVCTLMGLRTREDILSAIKDGRLRPRHGKQRGPVGYGWLSHYAIHDWLGLPRPPRVGRWIKCPHCGELIEMTGAPSSVSKIKPKRKA